MTDNNNIIDINNKEAERRRLLEKELEEVMKGLKSMKEDTLKAYVKAYMFLANSEEAGTLDLSIEDKVVRLPLVNVEIIAMFGAFLEEVIFYLKEEEEQ